MIVKFKRPSIEEFDYIKSLKGQKDKIDKFLKDEIQERKDRYNDTGIPLVFSYFDNFFGRFCSIPSEYILGYVTDIDSDYATVDILPKFIDTIEKYKDEELKICSAIIGLCDGDGIINKPTALAYFYLSNVVF